MEQDSAIRVRGPVAAPPHRPDGSLYRFELIPPDDRWRAYADDPAALLAELIPGYLGMDPDRRQMARTELAISTQVWQQAQVLVRLGTEGCDPDHLAVLRGNRDEQPGIETWTAPIPLILVESFYQPDGELPRPVAIAPGEIIWLDPCEDESLLASLHYVGAIVLAVITQ
jgi:hypothetical protein